jgi:hypothetical protein
MIRYPEIWIQYGIAFWKAPLGRCNYSAAFPAKGNHLPTDVIANVTSQVRSEVENSAAQAAHEVKG